MALIMSILSFIIFIRYSVNFFYSPTFGLAANHLTLLRCQLILTQAIVICMFGVFFHLLKNKGKLNILLNLSILSFLILLSFIIPNNLLFGINEAFYQNKLPDSDNVFLIVHGFTWWRALTDITILLFFFFTILVLIKRSDSLSFKENIIFSTGLVLILLAAFYDHLVDFGLIDTAYMLPFAIFIFYMILNFIPYVYLLKEVIDKNLLRQEEEKWRNLINEATVIVVGLNRMGQVDFVNPFFLKFAGYQEDEVLGKDWFEFFIPPKDYFNLQGAFIEILEFEFHHHYLNPILTKNKEEKMISWFNVRTRDFHGKITGSLSIGVDVTFDFKEKEDLLKKLKDSEHLIAKFSDKGKKS